MNEEFGGLRWRREPFGHATLQYGIAGVLGGDLILCMRGGWVR